MKLIERGAFNDIDIAMMVHPSPLTAIFNEYLAISQIQVTYIGKAVHAVAFPWEGINAVVQEYLLHVNSSNLGEYMLLLLMEVLNPI